MAFAHVRASFVTKTLVVFVLKPFLGIPKRFIHDTIVLVIVFLDELAVRAGKKITKLQDWHFSIPVFDVPMGALPGMQWRHQISPGEVVPSSAPTLPSSGADSSAEAAL